MIYGGLKQAIMKYCRLILAVVAVVVTSKSNKVQKQNNNFVCAAPFLKFIYVVTAQLRGENTKLHDLWRT